MLSLVGPEGAIAFESDEDLRAHVAYVPSLDEYTLYDIYPVTGEWSTVGLYRLATGEEIRAYKDWWNADYPS